MTTVPMTVLAYIRREVLSSLPEFTSLEQKDKDDLKAYATTEMEILGIPVKTG